MDYNSNTYLSQENKSADALNYQENVFEMVHRIAPEICTFNWRNRAPLRSVVVLKQISDAELSSDKSKLFDQFKRNSKECNETLTMGSLKETLLLRLRVFSDDIKGRKETATIRQTSLSDQQTLSQVKAELKPEPAAELPGSPTTAESQPVKRKAADAGAANVKRPRLVFLKKKSA